MEREPSSKFKQVEKNKQVLGIVSDESLWREANAIANEEFGDDRERATSLFTSEVKRFNTCKCGQCETDMINRRDEIVKKWTKPEREERL